MQVNTRALMRTKTYYDKDCPGLIPKRVTHHWREVFSGVPLIRGGISSLRGLVLISEISIDPGIYLQTL